VITIAVSKSDLIRLLNGTFITYAVSEKYAADGLVEPCGNQWNENWKWNSAKLQQMSEDELYALYTTVKNLN
jgi:hypothetical protein